MEEKERVQREPRASPFSVNNCEPQRNVILLLPFSSNSSLT